MFVLHSLYEQKSLRVTVKVISTNHLFPSCSLLVILESHLSLMHKIFISMGYQVHKFTCMDEIIQLGMESLIFLGKMFVLLFSFLKLNFLNLSTHFQLFLEQLESVLSGKEASIRFRDLLLICDLSWLQPIFSFSNFLQCLIFALMDGHSHEELLQRSREQSVSDYGEY